MNHKKETPRPDGKDLKNEPRDESFYLKILNDPFLAADLYSRPEDRDLCEPLVRALEDPDDVVRMAAVAALVSLDDLYAASEIFWMILHGSVHARLAAVRVLSRIGKGDDMSIRHLIAALSDPDPMVRTESRNALMTMGIDADSLSKSGTIEHPLSKKDRSGTKE